MIDFHNHVLPNIDDGSKSLEVSIEMLKCAHEQGITDVVNTVHFQHPKVEGRIINYDSIKKATIDLQKEIDNIDLPIKLHFGAEVYYQPNLLNIKDNPLLNYRHGKYILIEFQPHFIPENHKQVLFDLKMSGVTPIIAHPERYRLVQNNFNIINEWLNFGCIIQVSAGSILGRMGKDIEKTALKIINNNQCQILGSDAHNNKNRNFLLKDAYNFIEKIIGKSAIKLVLNNPKAVLEGTEITDNSNFNIPNKKLSLLNWFKIKK